MVYKQHSHRDDDWRQYCGCCTVIKGRSGTVAVPPPQHIELGAIPTLTFPPTTAYCLANFGLHCYQPFQLAKAYNLNPLHEAGIDGRGTTIVIVDSFGSPTIQNDLHVFDQTCGIPDPPSLTILQPAGPVPTFDPTNGDMAGWAAETTLDVEWAHAFAPGAAIILVETPVSETEGVQGFPEIVQAENYIIDNDLGGRHQPKLRRHRGDFPQPRFDSRLAQRFQECKKTSGHGAGRFG